MHRFFLQPEQFNNSAPKLDETESHHCLDVLRMSEGDRLTIFDGKGNEATAQIAEAKKSGVVLKVLQRSKTPAPPCRITLGQAVPKGKNMDLIVQKAVELGASKIAPILSDRTVVQLDAGEAEKKLTKWREIAVEACKQCGQNHLPDVALPVTPKQFFESGERSDLMLIASLQTDSRHIKSVLSEFTTTQGRKPRSVTILVGPEGDFTPAETSLAKSHGYLPVTLGPIILRTETAALYCLSVLSHELFAE